LAQGLVAAHAAHVIHRDLKPGNLMVTPDGRLKILDFGLAKPIDQLAANADTVTLAGARWVEGTLPYMAPEQVREGSLDERTDIYAAGAVLYEMATGHRPFPQSGPVLVEQILHTDPPLPRSLNSQLSPGLEAVILKALDKDPERRYQSAKELLVDLERLSAGISAGAIPQTTIRPRRARWAATVLLGVAFAAAGLLAWRLRMPKNAGAKQIRSIAVLPLENLSRDPDQAYFADGMTEELINKLAKIGALRVISRTSAMRYKGVQKALPEIARELGVDAVIEGSVLHSGDRVRVTAELIQGSSDKTLWSNSYQREVRDVLSLQSDVATAIVDEIRITVGPQERARLASARPVDPQAYEAYLKGRFYWNRRTGEDIERSITYFQRAVEKDPTYALAYSGLADAYHVLWVYSNVSPRQTSAQAKAAALKALELDDNLAEAHTSLAAILMDDDLDFAAAEREFQRALALNPNYSIARAWLAEYYVYIGDFDSALAEMKKAQEVDPLSPLMNTLYGGVFLLNRRYDEAIEWLNKAVGLDRNFYLAHSKLRDADLGKGMVESAITEDEIAARLAGLSQDEIVARAAAQRRGFAESGVKGYWRARLELALRRTQGSHGNKYDASAYFKASMYAHLGNEQEGFRWLDKAFDERDATIFYFNTAPEFDSMRSQPKGRDLLRRIGLPPSR
jgi:TolB-like protein